MYFNKDKIWDEEIGKFKVIEMRRKQNMKIEGKNRNKVRSKKRERC